MSSKPGWVRLSLHPTMTNAELDYVLTAIEQIADQVDVWGRDYEYDKQTNEYSCQLAGGEVDVKSWFEIKALAEV